MRVSNLIVEVTRQCNLKCDHCLRGEAESKTVDLNHVETLFNQINSIDSITFTGGEPALYPDKINDIMAVAKQNNIEIGNFYIATNGTVSSDEFIKCLMNLYLYCSDNEVSAVDISNDTYHDIDAMNQHRERLQCLRFVRNKWDKDYFNYYYGNKSSLIGEGFAENLDYVRTNTIDDIIIEDDTIEELYLNCEGNLIKGCDWSYNSQRDEEIIYCHVDKLDEAIYKHVNNIV